MYVFKDLHVYEKKADIPWNPSETYFAMGTEDTNPGFVKLLLVNCNYDYAFLCVEFEGDFYLSNILIKSHIKSMIKDDVFAALCTEVNHGPCLSDKEGVFDIALCVHSKSWISQVVPWITRPNQSWPSDYVKSKIIDHGVLFVPVGVKGSRYEEIEWRISFSVGEKLLINSFTHTQLLCYAVMKIILKDVINTNDNCRDLLCSYYIKNIMFWVSEEEPLSLWKPDNMIGCFMRCFRRLIYCVEYSFCPHYFIPENNMFENKIEGQNRRNLLYTLKTLYDCDWRCIMSSPQLQDFFIFLSTNETKTQLFIDNFDHINFSMVLSPFFSPIDNYYRAVRMISSYSSRMIRLSNHFWLSRICTHVAGDMQFTDEDQNKDMYKKYKVCQSYLLQNIHHDAVSGWLHLASMYYKMKQYRTSLDILSYSLSKCSQEKILAGSKCSSEQRKLLKLKMLQRKGLIRNFELLRVDNVSFIMNSTLIPKKLKQRQKDCCIPPVVYAHFLRLLCHFHLHDVMEFRNSLEDLQRTILGKYFIQDRAALCESLNCLNVAWKIFVYVESSLHERR